MEWPGIYAWEDKPRGGQGREGPGDLCQTHEPIRLTRLARNGARALPKPDEVCPAVVGEDAECMLRRGDGGIAGGHTGLKLLLRKCEILPVKYESVSWYIHPKAIRTIKQSTNNTAVAPPIPCKLNQQKTKEEKEADSKTPPETSPPKKKI